MKKKIGNWGNYPIVESDEHFFTNPQELSNKLNQVDHTMVRGNGRCYGDAALLNHTISTLKYNKMLSFDPEKGVFNCQSGVVLDQILEVIVPQGWFLPVTPGTKYITVGGAVGSDVHGKNHHVDGAFSSHIVDMDILLANGEMATCSPTLLPDLFEATCGGMGLTGIITRVCFRLKKIETAYIRQKQIKAANLTEVLALFDTYQHYTYSVAWIDCLQQGAGFGRSILILGEHATRSELSQSQQLNPLELPKKKQLIFPFHLPSWVLNTWTVKAFNALYYGKNTRKIIDSVVPYEPFFYPLDAILHWNRGYGKKGFIQYQFVLPLDARAGLIEILSEIGKSGMGSFLAVLKVFGKQDSLISFPTEGYTLALDFPVREGLFPFLDRLDDIVLQYGGRLYMSKDARMRPEVLRKGYPRLQEFMNILHRYDPKGKFRSVQSNRLAITA